MTNTQQPATESVWDYPRPPKVEPDERRVIVKAADRTLADTTRAVRVLETSHPPVFYLPDTDVDFTLLVPSPHTTFCEYKGRAVYWDVQAGADRIAQAGWSYPDPSPGFEMIKDWIAFYPSRVQCTVDGETVRPQEGGFYGGWITAEIVGPFKGAPGTSGW